MKVYTLTKREWRRLRDLSATAQSTPVILVGGVDMSRRAFQDVQDAWGEIASTHGFKVETVRPHNEAARQVLAEPVEAAAP